MTRRTDPRIARTIALAMFGVVVMSADPVATFACDACSFFLRSKPRTGAYAVHVSLARNHSRSTTAQRVTLTVVNHGSSALAIDTEQPIWQQTAVHIERVGGSGISDFDKPIGTHHARTLLAPGARFTFPPASLAHWDNMWYVAPGIYRVALTFGAVDSNIATFHIP